MTRTERAIAILTDAEPVFRLEYKRGLNNGFGLCGYIYDHKLCKRITETSYFKLVSFIFRGIDQGAYYWFCGGMSQNEAWHLHVQGYNSARSDFCLEKIKELEA